MARMSQRYPQELEDRAVRLVVESRDQYDSEWAAIESIATKLGIGSTETVRKWVHKADVDAGERPGVTTQEAAEVRRLRAENLELRRANVL
jgi:transposase